MNLSFLTKHRLKITAALLLSYTLTLGLTSILFIDQTPQINANAITDAIAHVQTSWNQMKNMVAIKAAPTSLPTPSPLPSPTLYQELPPTSTPIATPTAFPTQSAPTLSPTPRRLPTINNLLIPTFSPSKKPTVKPFIPPPTYQPPPTSLPNKPPQTNPTAVLPTQPPPPTAIPNVARRSPKNLEEAYQLAAAKTCVPYGMIRAIADIETRAVSNMSAASFAVYNTYGWWKRTDINKDGICSGYGYNSCTNQIPADSNFGGQYCGSGPKAGVCRQDIQVMGVMQIGSPAWNTQQQQVAQLLGTTEVDRRVITDSIIGGALYIKNTAGKTTSCSAWPLYNVVKAACSYYGKCVYNVHGKTGNYCQIVCNSYNGFTSQKLDCASIPSKFPGDSCKF